MLSLPILLTCVLAADAPALTDATNAVADARSLATIHELLASEPHVAGTPGDLREIERLTKAFRDMGLDVEVHQFEPFLCRPIEARLEIVGEEVPEGTRRGVLSLDLRERNLLEDPATAHPDLSYGWNAYSGSADVTAGVVYANYGTREDFLRLKELGIDVQGKIVLARYGGNFRGYKAKFAEEAGAAGLLIFTDPADSGFTKGTTWPEGTWANDTCIQRGSLLTLPWPGDPLTPGIEATHDAKRLDPGTLGFPTIPVQPIGYAAAERIIARMKGERLVDEQWKGGIKQLYRYEGGAALQVRLVIRQERFIGKTANVIATLKGATLPQEMVVVGCHHDAWCFGAADPLAGTMVLLESARCFADAAKRGQRPDRSLVFAAWGAEEFGIIGSTEWVESRRKELEQGAVAYINLDMASMGDRFGAGASPSMRPAIVAATKRAISPFDGQPVFEAWTTPKAPATERSPSFGDLGGGSDHVGFWCHAGVPSISIGAQGAPGTSYHSNYDTVAWYRRTVGEDYRSALLVTRVNNALIAELASGVLLADDPLSVVRDTERLLAAANERATKASMRTSLGPAIEAFAALRPIAMKVSSGAVSLRGDAELAQRANIRLRTMRSAWLDDAGLPNRVWFRNLFAATDRYSGYAASMLPLLSEAIEDRDEERLAKAVERYVAIAAVLKKELESLVALGSR